MNEPFTDKRRFWEGTRFAVRARIPNEFGQMLSPSEVTSWTLKVFDLSADATAHTAVFTQTSTDASQVLFNALQPWPGRNKGYNFRHVTGDGDFTTVGGHLYQLDYELTLAVDGGPIVLQWEMACVVRGA